VPLTAPLPVPLREANVDTDDDAVALGGAVADAAADSAAVDVAAAVPRVEPVPPILALALGVDVRVATSRALTLALALSLVDALVVGGDDAAIVDDPLPLAQPEADALRDGCADAGAALVALADPVLLGELAGDALALALAESDATRPTLGDGLADVDAPPPLDKMPAAFCGAALLVAAAVIGGDHFAGVVAILGAAHADAAAWASARRLYTSHGAVVAAYTGVVSRVVAQLPVCEAADVVVWRAANELTTWGVLFDDDTLIAFSRA
jgi:hypothetical protein